MTTNLFAGLAGALRLDNAVPRNVAFEAQAQQDVPGDPNYYQRLTNLFPAEGLALYGTGVALYLGANAFVVLCALVVLAVLRWVGYGSGGDGQGSRTVAVAIAVASFRLWATATDPKWLAAFMTLTKESAEDIRRGAAFAGAAAVLVAPLIVKVPTRS